MKVLRSIIYFLTASVICLAVYLFTGFRDYATVKEESPVVASFAKSPEVPQSVRFCGAEIDITRYNMKEGMDRELTGFTYLHSTTMLLIKRANRYFPVIEPILKANGIPDDFKYLAVIESNLDPKALSPSRAVGLWQFMESTGKSYGLRITPTVDERRNVVKSTEAACKYLKDAYNKYGDWITVAVSYNAGMGRVTDQINNQGESSVLNLHFVEETTRYPYRLFAIKQVFENPYKYGYILRAENLYSPIDCSEVVVDKDITDLAAFAREKGITYNDLKFFNPWLKDTKLLTGGGRYNILIPNKNKLYYRTSNNYVHDKRWVVEK
jgi:Soluble lytic murein transglycosylase and related regulatory proteins (some contain LysM/invasin domains)